MTCLAHLPASLVLPTVASNMTVTVGVHPCSSMSACFLSISALGVSKKMVWLACLQDGTLVALLGFSLGSDLHVGVVCWILACCMFLHSVSAQCSQGRQRMV